MRWQDRTSQFELFSWKRAMVVIAAGIGGVSYKTYQSYQQKGHLGAVDFWVAATTIAILLGIMASLGWWANRAE